MYQITTSAALPRPPLTLDIERLHQAVLLRHVTLADPLPL